MDGQQERLRVFMYVKRGADWLMVRASFSRSEVYPRWPASSAAAAGPGGPLRDSDAQLFGAAQRHDLGDRSAGMVAKPFTSRTDFNTSESDRGILSAKRTLTWHLPDRPGEIYVR